MFCWNCGKEIDDNAVICIHCGVSVNGKNKYQDNDYDVGSILGIIGFIFAFIVPIVGLVCCIISDKRAEEKGRNDKFAIAGIIISVVVMAVVIVSVVISVVYISCLESNYFL